MKTIKQTPKMPKVEYDVLSPDGFSISHSVVYRSPEDALENAKKWALNFERQGYYSSNKGRIPLSELLKHCKLQLIMDNQTISTIALL